MNLQPDVYTRIALEEREYFGIHVCVRSEDHAAVLENAPVTAKAIWELAVTN